MPPEIDRHLAKLELSRGASWEEIRAARRRLVKAWHPDRFPGDAEAQCKAQERLKEVNHAYRELKLFFDPAPQTLREPSEPSPAPRASAARSTGAGAYPSDAPDPGPPQDPDAREGQRSRSWRWAFRVRFSRQMLLGVLSVVGLAAVGFLLVLPLYLPEDFSIAALRGARAEDPTGDFGAFRLGMTLPEAVDACPPPSVDGDAAPGVVSFVYTGTPANRAGGWTNETLTLRFFEGRLYSLTVEFTSHEEQRHQRFQKAYRQAVTRELPDASPPVTVAVATNNTLRALLVADKGGPWRRLTVQEIAIAFLAAAPELHLLGETNAPGGSGGVSRQ